MKSEFLSTQDSNYYHYSPKEYCPNRCEGISLLLKIYGFTDCCDDKIHYHLHIPRVRSGIFGDNQRKFYEITHNAIVKSANKRRKNAYTMEVDFDEFVREVLYQFTTSS